MKDESCAKVMTKFVGQKAKSFNYLIDSGNEDKKINSTKKCAIYYKEKLNLKIVKTAYKELNLRTK